MTTHKRIGEEFKLVAVFSPATINNTEKVTPAVDFSKFSALIAVLALGDMASEAVDFRMESCASSGFGSGVTTRVAATQLAASGTLNDSKQIILEIDQSQVAGDQFARARAIGSDATGGPGCILLFGKPLYSTQAHVTSVAEYKHA
jgi:hypothetical protein